MNRKSKRNYWEEVSEGLWLSHDAKWAVHRINNYTWILKMRDDSTKKYETVRTLDRLTKAFNYADDYYNKPEERQLV